MVTNAMSAVQCHNTLESCDVMALWCLLYSATIQQLR